MATRPAEKQKRELRRDNRKPHKDSRRKKKKAERTFNRRLPSHG